MHQPTAHDLALVPLFQHTKAHQWGLAMLAWERGAKRGYQFEDGKLRIFRDGYYDLLDEVDAPADQAREIIAKLSLHAPTEPALSPVAKPATATLTLDQQIEIFRRQHADGFAGDTWRSKRRGLEQGRRTKRHRVPAIADAAERLGDDALTAHLDAGRAAEVVTTIVDVLATTDTVSAQQLAPLRTVPVGRHAVVASALHELLWDTTPFELRFERAVSTLTMTSRRAPSWQLMTALGALAHPTEHVHVSPLVVRRQAAYMAPRLVIGATPAPRAYLRTLEMVQRVATALEAVDLPPADLWDVHDFMADTLAPRAVALLQH